jgi:ribosomal protein L40E
MPNPQTSPRRRNADIKCLKCGAFNIPDNRICGRCGANLPLVYDDQGQVFNWAEAQGFEALVHQPTPKTRASAGKIRWILRALVLLGAVLCAMAIMRGRQ